MSTTPKPLFVYGPLCALPLLAWVITGDTTKVDEIKKMVREARVSGYKRCAVHHNNFPAAIKDETSFINGYVVFPEAASQRQRLDNSNRKLFYKNTTAAATFIMDPADGREETTEVDILAWDGDVAWISTEPWDLERFIADHLDFWLAFVGEFWNLDAVAFGGSYERLWLRPVRPADVVGIEEPYERLRPWPVERNLKPRQKDWSKHPKSL